MEDLVEPFSEEVSTCEIHCSQPRPNSLSNLDFSKKTSTFCWKVNQLRNHHSRVGLSNNNLCGSIIFPAGNIAELLVANGMAKVVDWSITLVTGGPTKLRAAER